MADEGVRALYAPRESTSVWRADADQDTAVVATLAWVGKGTRGSGRGFPFPPWPGLDPAGPS